MNEAELTQGSDYAANICTCGRLILRHADSTRFWHADSRRALDHKATPRPPASYYTGVSLLTGERHDHRTHVWD